MEADRPPRTLLVVEDEEPVRNVLAAMLRDSDWESALAASAEEALELVRERDFDVVLSDVVMPGRSGIDLVTELRQIRPETPVLLMTGFASLDSAVESMRAGAYDYLTKPLRRRELLEAVGRAYAQREREVERSRPGAMPTTQGPRLIGSSPALRRIAELVEKVADTASSVLITGESGTGKELVARAIHSRSARGKARFVAINCTAIPEGLLESELFGHVRGAFTGAVTNHAGLFEAADGGTLFLDEIGDMGLELQGKLLRVLQEREVRPVGGTRSTRVDVRIVAATNQDLRAAIGTGRFRADLFYRLNVIPMHIPPLRERPEDARDLANHFAQLEGAVIEDDALAVLMTRDWEGNVRELQNAIERALALGDGRIVRVRDLAAVEPPAAVGGPPLEKVEEALDVLVRQRVPLKELEERLIEKTLEATGGNKNEAARVLGISRRTVYRRGTAPPPRED